MRNIESTGTALSTVCKNEQNVRHISLSTTCNIEVKDASLIALCIVCNIETKRASLVALNIMCYNPEVKDGMRL